MAEHIWVLRHNKHIEHQEWYFGSSKMAVEFATAHAGQELSWENREYVNYIIAKVSYIEDYRIMRKPLNPPIPPESED